MTQERKLYRVSWIGDEGRTPYSYDVLLSLEQENQLREFLDLMSRYEVADIVEVDIQPIKRATVSLPGLVGQFNDHLESLETNIEEEPEGSELRNVFERLAKLAKKMSSKRWEGA